MIKESTTPEEVVRLLNDLLKDDPECITNLINNKIECNKTIAEHETVQVSLKDGIYRLGIVGLLNGIFGINDNGFGCIASYWEDGKLKKFIYDKNLGNVAK
jgi:hypothetical protein